MQTLCSHKYVTSFFLLKLCGSCLLVKVVCSFMSFKLLFFVSDTAVEKDFEIVNATVLWRNNAGCFRIVIVDDSDPEPAENFTISFVVNKVQPEGVKTSINQSEAVITIQENDRKSYWCTVTLSVFIFHITSFDTIT